MDNIELMLNKLFENKVVLIENIYLKNKEKFYWYDINDKYISINLPNNIIHDEYIKKDILENALLLDKNMGIIDCGAHIGDGVIPIAHALKILKREDIIIYALDPCINKCNAIKYLAYKNNLKNIKIINCGLTDKPCLLYPNIPNVDSQGLPDKNTGGTVWIPEKINLAGNAHLYKVGEPFYFKTLEDLIINKEINHNIGLIHLDVEDHEYKVLSGSLNIINKFMPYISLEDHNNDIQKFEKLLKNYKFVKRIEQNNIFIPIHRD